MRDQLKEIILDNQTTELSPGVKRELNLEVLPKKASIVIGVRRAGKSTFMMQIMQQLVESKVSRENIVQINFFDNRLYGLHHSNLELILDTYFSIYPTKKQKETVYFFFDEIQEVENWEPFVERLLRTENCMVYITGSSAKMLSKEIATQMRGRALAWELFPFSFVEYLKYKKIKYSTNMSSGERIFVQNCFAEYFTTGAFPEVVDVTRRIRIKLHQEYFNTILFRDIIERHDVKSPQTIMEVANLLINNISNSYTINSIVGRTKSLGHKTSKSIIGEYLEWFEDAYFLFSVKIFDASAHKANVNPKKIYCIDHALVSSVSSGLLVNSGHLLENLIFITLRRRNEKIYYYKTKNSREVDFIVADNQNHRLIQVCESLQDPKTKKRELTALMEAMQEMQIKSATIVTLNEEEVIDEAKGKINVIPAWKFLLFEANQYAIS